MLQPCYTDDRVAHPRWVLDGASSPGKPQAYVRKTWASQCDHCLISIPDRPPKINSGSPSTAIPQVKGQVRTPQWLGYRSLTCRIKPLDPNGNCSLSRDSCPPGHSIVPVLLNPPRGCVHRGHGTGALRAVQAEKTGPIALQKRLSVGASQFGASPFDGISGRLERGGWPSPRASAMVWHVACVCYPEASSPLKLNKCNSRGGSQSEFSDKVLCENLDQALPVLSPAPSLSVPRP